MNSRSKAPGIFIGGVAMTVAERLYRSDPETLFNLIVMYQLEWLAKLYFKDMVIDDDSPIAKDEAREREYTKLMRPSSYTGRVERRRGAITQPHRPRIG